MAIANIAQIGTATPPGRRPVWMVRIECWCDQCDHRWWSRWHRDRGAAPHVAARCPQCRSAHWNRPSRPQA